MRNNFFFFIFLDFSGACFFSLTTKKLHIQYFGCVLFLFVGSLNGELVYPLLLAALANLLTGFS